MRQRSGQVSLTLLVTLFTLPVGAQIDPEVGPDDFQLSLGESSAISAVAYGTARGEYLAAWLDKDQDDVVVQRRAGDGSALSAPVSTGFGSRSDLRVTYDPVNDRFLVTASGQSIVGVLVQATGSVGAPFQITGAQIDFDAAFNTERQEYIVCWVADSFLWFRWVDADGQLLGLEDTAVRFLNYFNVDPRPQLAYNTQSNEFLVTWEADPGQVGHPRIWVSRFDALGDYIGGSETSISGIDAYSVDVAYNPVHNEYLVVWRSSDPSEGPNIYGQRLDGLAGEVGPEDFRISTLGSPESYPRVTFNTRRDRFLVTWHSATIANDTEVFGQYLSRVGTRLEPGNFKVSNFGPRGDDQFEAKYGSSAYNPDQDEFLVVFSGKSPSPTGYVILGQRLYGAPTVFSDGFEFGDLRKWSLVSP